MLRPRGARRALLAALSRSAVAITSVANAPELACSVQRVSVQQAVEPTVRAAPTPLVLVERSRCYTRAVDAWRTPRAIISAEPLFYRYVASAAIALQLACRLPSWSVYWCSLSGLVVACHTSRLRLRRLAPSAVYAVARCMAADLSPATPVSTSCSAVASSSCHHHCPSQQRLAAVSRHL